MPRLKRRHNLGKYRIERCLGEGGFAVVYRAFDSIQGIRVALKIPHDNGSDGQILEDVIREVRLVTTLDHPGILPLKDAGYVDGQFVLVHPLGEETLTDRMARRITPRTALDFSGQLLDAVAYAHERRVIHCDIKPDNVILFEGGVLRLTDFGIAKIALRTRPLTASGTGTIGFLAPEQAFGRPSLRSDVFALGLVMYRLCAGALPEWPYRWPGPGHERLRRNFRPAFLDFLRRAIQVDERHRFANASRMRDAFHRMRRHALKAGTPSSSARDPESPTWRTARVREFQRRFGRVFSTREKCARCDGPVSEFMGFCPWCGRHAKRYDGAVSFPVRCPRCRRGAKRDWPYCAWCYGGGIQDPGSRTYSDKRYQGRCASCRGDLLPHSRYCPWCRAKVRRPWRIDGTKDRCVRCRNSVAAEFWRHCAWCGIAVQHGGV